MQDESTIEAARTAGAAPAAATPLGGLRRVCVYCGSSAGTHPGFAKAAAELGRLMAESGVELVYGGGDVGLMGVVAQSVLTHGGRVTGIIPEFLRRRENMLKDVQDLVVVPDMHARKQLMFERSDAFVALPGGIGTLEELVEQMTWAQLGRHGKPILLLNVERFWDPLIALLEHMRIAGFIRPGLELSYLVADAAEAVLPLLASVPRATADNGRGSFVTEHF